MRHVWTIACARTLSDSETNNISLLDVIEQVNLNPPAKQAEYSLPINLSVVTAWYRSDVSKPERFMHRLSFVFPSGKKELGGTTEVVLTEHLRGQCIGQISGMTVEEGMHYFVAESSIDSGKTWVEMGRLPLQIVVTVTAPSTKK